MLIYSLKFTLKVIDGVFVIKWANQLYMKKVQFKVFYMHTWVCGVIESDQDIMG